VAKYYTPKGNIIQDNGITPNVKVASSDELAFIPDDDDGGAATTPDQQQQKETKPKEDDQLKKAIDVLKTKAPVVDDRVQK
jgi:C-terminal processing protease CtpA/Prc